MNPARPHSMRSAFRSRLTNRAAETFIEYLMGHKLNGTESAYLNMPNEALVKDYLEIEKYLSIETTSKDILAGRPSEGEQSHILRAYQEQMGDLQNKNDALSKMVDSLAKKSEEQERLLQMVVDRLVWLEGEEKDMPEDAHMMTAAEKEKYGKISNF
ncbi:MAG: hypothetical protein H8E40_01370 [Chloroflexi bacterium]|nr:hypothetical protein [Chloroflexota bacterium]